VENFNDLCSILNADNEMNIEIAERIAKDNKAYYEILSFQQMHNLLKHKVLQFLFKGLSYIAPICFGPHGPSSGSTYQNLTKVIISFKIIS
jgi:hypothetical protein